ncbi:MAG: hypothetical protein R3257_07315, partial [bacterium]|nr:hypothetical protein [bacterium]
MSLEVGGLGFAAHPWPGMIPSPDSGPALEAVVSASLESAFDPAALSGMLMAGASFGVGRLFFSRLAGSQIKNPYLIRSLGSLGGFAVEVPAFVAGSKTVGMVLGRPADFRPSTLKEEMAGAALVLGSLKLTGWGTFQSLRRFYGPKPAPALTQGVAIQSGMLGGIMGGHYLEGNYHGQEFPGGAEFFSQSLATLFQFNIAGSMLPHLAPGLHRLQQKFSQHETTRRVLSAWAPPRTLPWGPPTPT